MDVAYLPLARKYRPTKFSEVVGQDVAVKIIINGIEKNRLGPAVIFTGTRGVGKTTIARLIAKAVMCENYDSDNHEHCGKCSACLSSFEQQLDVIEMDAASHTSVDDIREIIQTCRYSPAIGRYRIYIIDEVHMLSKSAFNALLKTLEEPPVHAKFIFATTEIYKVPETILSRCLRFDLKRIDHDVIAQFLSTICNKEGIAADSDCLHAIADVSYGSIRDALSLLDQAINLCGRTLSLENIHKMLGIADDVSVATLSKHICESDIKNSLLLLRKMVREEISPEETVNKLMDQFHYIACMKCQATYIQQQNFSNDALEILQNIEKKISMAAVTKMWQMLLKGLEELSIAQNKIFTLEMLVIRIAYSAGLPDLYSLIGDSYKTSAVDLNTNSMKLSQSALKMFPGAVFTKIEE